MHEVTSGATKKVNIHVPITVKRVERVLVPAGRYKAILEGFESQARPRSGVAYKHGMTVLNSPGTLDSDYRGEVKVLLVNLSNEPFTIFDGERIAQLVLAQHYQFSWNVVEQLDDTVRADGGFGHTGTK